MHIWFRSKIGAYGSFPLEPETTRQL